MHCGSRKENSFRDAWGTDILISPCRNSTRGVVIFTKGVKIKFGKSKKDEGGNYILA